MPTRPGSPSCRRASSTRSSTRRSPSTRSWRRAGTWSSPRRWSRWTRPPPCRCATAGSRRPTAPSPRRANSSAGSCSSRPGTSTRPSGSPGGSRARASAASRCGRPSTCYGSARPGGSGGVDDPRARIDRLYRTESRRVLATLIRLLGDFDLAEEALQDAFMAAAERWPRTASPRTRVPGSSQPGASRPSTGCGAGPGSTRSSASWPRGSTTGRPPTPPTRTTRSSRTTGCGSSSSAAIRPCRPTPRWR